MIRDLWFTLCLLAGLLAAPAAAERYAVGAGQLGPVRTADAPSYLARCLWDTRPGLLTALVPPATGAPAAVPLPGTLGKGEPGVDPARTPRGLADLDRFLGPLGPPDAAFAAELARVYSVTAPSEVTAVWRWFAGEPSGLALRERVGNAMVRHMMSTGRFTAEARPDGMRAGVRQARVRSSNGVSLRQAPWGDSVGEITGGAVVQVIPPSHGIWHHVATSAGGGWACGLFLEAR